MGFVLGGCALLETILAEPPLYGAYLGRHPVWEKKSLKLASIALLCWTTPSCSCSGYKERVLETLREALTPVPVMGAASAGTMVMEGKSVAPLRRMFSAVH